MGSTNLSAAQMKGASLRSTDLTNVQNLTQEQINQTFGDVGTTLPVNLVTPRHWDSKKISWSERDPKYLEWLITCVYFDPDDKYDICPPLIQSR